MELQTRYVTTAGDVSLGWHSEIDTECYRLVQ